MSETQEQTRALAKSAANGTAVEAKPAEQRPQYVSGFEGMASAPFSEQATAALLAPVDDDAVEIRPDGIVYLPGVWYRRRLTKAFGPGGWALAPRGPARTLGDLVTYHGALYCLGRFVSEAVGECTYRPGNETMSYASALEGARTDCLTRACKDLGVATELWDPAWREGWLARWADFEWVERNGKRKKNWWRLSEPRDAKAPPAAPPPRESGRKAKPVDVETEPLRPKAVDAPATARHAVLVEAPPAPEPAPAPAPVDVEAEAADTGEASEPHEHARLRDVAKQLGWPKTRAVNWLKKHFDVATVEALTKQQAADCLVLLLGAQQEGDLYDRVLAELAAMGRVKP